MVELNMTAFDSKFECPICHRAVIAGHSRKHFDRHKNACEIPSELDVLICKIVKRGQALKQSHYKKFRKKRKSRQHLVGKDKKLDLPDYDELYRSEDLWERQRPFSGGGGPGTGRRR